MVSCVVKWYCIVLYCVVKVMHCVVCCQVVYCGVLWCTVLSSGVLWCQVVHCVALCCNTCYCGVVCQVFHVLIPPHFPHTVPKGTPAFMAPEVLLPETVEQAGPQSDVWSLGATLFYMIHGKLIGLTPPSIDLI